MSKTWQELKTEAKARGLTAMTDKKRLVQRIVAFDVSATSGA